MVNQKNALKKLWKDKLTITEFIEMIKLNGSTSFIEAIVLRGEPCKLSFSTLKNVNQNDSTAEIVQVTKLFCDNEIRIKAGSKISIERQGEIFEYVQSGEPGIFTSHQEIILVPFERWA